MLFHHHDSVLICGKHTSFVSLLGPCSCCPRCNLINNAYPVCWFRKEQVRTEIHQIHCILEMKSCKTKGFLLLVKWTGLRWWTAWAKMHVRAERNCIMPFSEILTSHIASGRPVYWTLRLQLQFTLVYGVNSTLGILWDLDFSPLHFILFTLEAIQ